MWSSKEPSRLTSASALNPIHCLITFLSTLSDTSCKLNRWSHNSVNEKYWSKSRSRITSARDCRIGHQGYRALSNQTVHLGRSASLSDSVSLLLSSLLYLLIPFSVYSLFQILKYVFNEAVTYDEKVGESFVFRNHQPIKIDEIIS